MVCQVPVIGFRCDNSILHKAYPITTGFERYEKGEDKCMFLNSLSTMSYVARGLSYAK